jgi:hypothetical protein
MEGHSAEQLTQSLLNFLKANDIDIKDCRGQSYDNASNMSGKFRGLQARIKEMNKFAHYIPCLAHSLNLVGKCAAEGCQEAVIFFGFVESLYTFFSASTYRWGLLSTALCAGGTHNKSHLPFVKRLSDTRWSARADATKALLHSFSAIKQVLDDISDNNDQKAECRQQARGLLSTMMKLETGIMIILWDQVLQRFQMTSASLQSSDQDLNTACALYESLRGYIQAMRSTFADIEQKAKDLTECEYYQEQTRRKHKRNREYDDFSGSSTLDPLVESQTPSQQYKSRTFLVLIDSLLSALSKRQKAYQKLTDVFGFLRQLQSFTPEEVVTRSSNLIKSYPEDLEESLCEELVQFTELLKTDLASHIGTTLDLVELQFYRLIIDNSLESCFPNVEIALRIYLSLMVTNCSGERSFSKLKLIKNELRSTMGQKRLNNLTLMSIEHKLLREMDTSYIINKFSHAKCRKINI